MDGNELSREHFNKGYAYSDKGEYDKAIESYNKAIELYPENADAYNARGRAYMSKYEWEKAIKDFTKAIKLKPDCVNAYLDRSCVYFNTKNYERAIIDLKKITQKYDNYYYSAQLVLGYIHYNRRKYDEAVKFYERIPKNTPTYEKAKMNIEAIKWSIEYNKTEIKPCIFLSHSSNDKKYGDVFQTFITGLGVQDEQLIYTSHHSHKIPLNENISDYLQKQFNGNVFVIFLLSDNFFESSTCLNEMGAMWVTKKDYSSAYLPKFDFSNPKFRSCVIDKDKMGIVLNGDKICKKSFIELKDTVIYLFNLVEEAHTPRLIDKAIKELKEINKSL